MMLQLPVAQSQSLYAIFFFRFLQGVFGSAPSAILSGTLADIWTPKQRGFAMPSTGTFLMIGPSLGPMVGSEIVKSALGWYVKASQVCRVLADFAPQALDWLCHGYRLARDRCDHSTSTARDILTNSPGQ